MDDRIPKESLEPVGSNILCPMRVFQWGFSNDMAKTNKQHEGFLMIWIVLWYSSCVFWTKMICFRDQMSSKAGVDCVFVVLWYAAPIIFYTLYSNINIYIYIFLNLYSHKHSKKIYSSIILHSPLVLVIPPAPGNQSSMSSRWPRVVAQQKSCDCPA